MFVYYYLRTVVLVKINSNKCFITKGAFMARKITKRQQQIYDFIRSYQLEKGYPPSVREMAAAVGLSSPSTVHAHLSALEQHGLIRRDKTKPRALEVFNEDGTNAQLANVTEPPTQAHSYSRSMAIP